MVGRDRFGVLGSLLRWNHAHFNLDIDCDDEMKVQSEFFFFFFHHGFILRASQQQTCWNLGEEIFCI